MNKTIKNYLNQSKKVLILILFVFFCGSAFSQIASTTLGLSGSGEKEDPYQITSTEDLLKLSGFCLAGQGNNTSGKYFKLTQDITFSTDRPSYKLDKTDSTLKSNFVPIGGLTEDTINGQHFYKSNPNNPEECAFQGIFDGNGHFIKNLIIRRSITSANNDYQRYCGLFGRIKNAKIKNLIVKDGVFEGLRCVGAIVGTVYTKTNNVKDTIDNCASVNNKITALGQCGYIVGSGGKSKPTCYITNCYVQCSDTTQINRNYTNTSNIDNSYRSQVGPIYGNNDSINSNNLTNWRTANNVFASNWKGSHIDTYYHENGGDSVNEVSLSNVKGDWVEDFDNINNGYPVPGKYIKSNEKVVVTSVADMPSQYVHIEQNGSFVNNTTTAFKGNAKRRVVPLAWNMFGKCMTDTIQTGVLNINKSANGNELDMAALYWDYAANNWSNNYLLTDYSMQQGNSILVYPMDSTYSIVNGYTGHAEDNSAYTDVTMEGTFNNQTSYTFPFVCTSSSTSQGGTTYTPGYWAMLANPYPATLYLDKFMADNVGKIQGNCVYVLRPKYKDKKSSVFQIVLKDKKDSVSLSDGFVVNMPSANQQYRYTFKKTQLTQATGKKTSLDNMITCVTKTDDREIEAYLNINNQATNDFDIWDAYIIANSDAEIVTPYFVVDNRQILKNEIKTLPYSTGINFQSMQTNNFDFYVKNIPEGVSVSLIDTVNNIETSLNNGNICHLIANAGENDHKYIIQFKGELSIENQADNQEDLVMSLYPNPAVESTKLTISGLTTDADILLTDIQGRELKQYKINRNDSSVEIKTNDLSSGIYYVKIITEKNTHCQKLVVK